MNMCISTTLAYFKLMNIKPNVSELSRELGIDHHTLKKHFDAGGVKPRKKRKTNLIWKYKAYYKKYFEVILI